MVLTKRITFLFLIISISFQSCNILDSPDTLKPEEELKALLPYAQYLTAYWSGTDNARFPLQWSQQLSGVRNLHLRVDKYNLTHSEVNTVWNLYYQYILTNLETIILLSNDVDAKAYRGIANILKVYTSGLMTDAWGDIPYQNALSVRAPYDPQEVVLMQNMSLLDQAIQDLNNATKHLPTGDEDIIYRGDLEKWKKAANVIKLRLHLRLANVSANYESLLTIMNTAQLFSGNQDNMEYQFDGNENVNPHFFFDNEIRNTRVGLFFVQKLEETNDPRLPVFVKHNLSGNYKGSAPGGAELTASYVGTPLASRTSPVSFISFTEQKFIAAEVYLRTNQQAQADNAYNEAVKASLEQHGVSDSQWEQTHASIENVTLEQIINAKYIALFLNPEVWADYRRTGYPALTPFDGESNDIPRRLIYPLDEITNNPANVPSDVDIYTRVWWDVE